ncbi:tryptophan-rich sensory protein [Aureibacillus halotolerans]|uniref:TspO/MBR related protein n=1 Tax=Aureibacillus halotolerans TaxID=1508390 RepID=A0A4R6U2B7_9BACI|nr:tryptophan-rich sensory protein [Aureibacillus halotolerans]TDQ39786.1 TspO/MBR related protein [Aureibacillus halotolerans]
MQKYLLPVLNTLAFIAVIIVNYLANALPLFGRSTGEISDMVANLLTPAGYAFAIWSVIYLLTGIWVVLQWVPSWRERTHYKSVGLLFVLASACNVTWLLLWHSLLFYVTLLVMALFLVTLIILYRRLRNNSSTLSLLPFSIYLGWISVATIQNVAVVINTIYSAEPTSFDQMVAVIVLLVGTLISGYMLVKQGDRWYPIVFIWAYGAIGVKQSTYPFVSYSAWVLAALLVVLIVWHVFKKQRTS